MLTEAILRRRDTIAALQHELQALQIERAVASIAYELAGEILFDPAAPLGLRALARQLLARLPAARRRRS